ncbi:SdpI family protein [Geothrix sp. 21YS21S-2]|uniref:SdpI family protein n=1 Tax=Geothrix sp. 21YS21S-2 TaxID=3068893 RepID=UPI0027B97C05|nr:SdpI family protein [Geothrix sp. 21YS21S-2]
MDDELLPVSEEGLQLRREWPSWVLLAAVWGFSLWAAPRLPAQVAVHWGLDGRPNGWASPLQAALLLPGLLTVVYGLSLLFLNGPFDFRAARSMDPALARRVRLLLVLFLGGLQALTLGGALRGGAPGATGILALLALFFILLGNLMPRLEPNALVGIRIPPTLEDRAVWKRTHRLGGRVFMAGGLLQLAACLLPGPVAGPVVMALIGAMVVVPVVYAYRIRPAQPPEAR